MDAEEDDEEDRRDRLAPGEDLQTSLDDINMLRTVRAANTISKFFRMRYGQTHVTILLEYGIHAHAPQHAHAGGTALVC